LIVAGEGHVAAQGGGGLGEGQTLFSRFRPREIFTLKRSRDEFETGDRMAVDAGGQGSLQLPTEEDIRVCISSMHQLAGFSPGCLIVAMIYLERLRRTSGALMLASTWQPMLLISTIVAQKVWEDERHMNAGFIRLCPDLTLPRLNQLEFDFLSLLDYQVSVRAAVYTDWYFKVCSLIERSNVGRKPLDAEEATRLEVRTMIYEQKLRDKGPRSNSAPLPGDHDAQPTRSRAILS
jgi:hypothetical protein